MDEDNISRPVRTSLLPYGKQWLDDNDIQAVLETLHSDFITQGPQIERFERKVADYAGVQYAVAFCNGTAALHAACYAAGIGEGDEVITTPNTFLASSNCVMYMGGKPVFADINPITYNIDPDRVAEQINERTKAIIPVDFSGQPAEMDRLEMLARDHGLTIIHDAAHSLGASYGGRKVGTFGDMTMFSFHPVKLVTTGEGGMIVTNRADLYEKLLLFRNHGMTRDPGKMEYNEGSWYYEMQALGYNYRMTELQAALGVSQMDKLDGFVASRRKIAKKYDRAFDNIPGLVTPRQHAEAESSWHLYVLRWEPQHFKVGRKEIFEALRELQIGVQVHYIPVYKQPYYRANGFAGVHCPNAEAYYETALSLPIFPKMTKEDIQDVIEAVNTVVQRYKI
ncbi:UDP-4-amino-4,6-dideoxy-N-acetyl-beta-L-altrosamine transaminase [Paenibacillus tarimensis]|uniref:UDP-4-amino-4, 6-dideoxy-N-acetyl-beta-L-altrosamine transaminase n=1 Tax=Paenibacillus tarimensis TaxID=416012 RepID=UPI0039EF6216